MAPGEILRTTGERSTTSVFEYFTEEVRLPNKDFTINPLC